MEKKFFSCAEFLPDGSYVVGSSSGAVYLCKENTALTIVSSFHSKLVGELVFDPISNKLYSAGFDRMLKCWAVTAAGVAAPASGPEASPSDSKKPAASSKPAAGGKKTTTSVKKPADKKAAPPTDKKAASKSSGKKGAFELEWEKEIEIAGSDLVMLPRAMQLDSNEGRLYVGTKTNQIMVYEMKSEEASVLVDGHDGAVWGLCTHPQLPLFATGGYDNAVKLWDAESLKCTWTYEFDLRPVKVDEDKTKMEGYQVCCGAWSPDGQCLVFGTEDSNLAVFRYVSESEVEFQTIVSIPPKRKGAEVEAISYLRFSDDGQLLAVAHMDSNLYIFTIEGGSGGRIVLNQWNPLPHVAAPTNVQFSEGGKYVKTFTRDYEIAHWKLDRKNNRGKFVPTTPDPDKIKWVDDPLIAGWDVEGLYQPGWDGTDLNDATITSDGRLVVSGDDYGKVRLHNYPAIAPEANHCYPGHAEFVVGVEFLRDDSQLITCGGEDMAIFQWRLHKTYT